VLLLDEPLGALDLKLRKQLQVELKRIQRDVGITFVYVTHDQEEALTMSDRIAVMNHGVVEQLDDPEEIYERPSTTFVAGFIGVSNLMPGEVVATGTGTVELRLDAGPRVRAGGAGASVGERAHAVVRPEKLQLHPVNGAGAPSGPSVEGQVESSLYLGTATQVIVRLPDDTRMTVLVPNTDEEARRRLPAAGDPARLVWSAENIHMVKEAGQA
jgi:spermidine/putrescine transport system ATP-binding protein